MNSLGNAVYKTGIERIERKNESKFEQQNQSMRQLSALAIVVIEWAAILLYNLYDILQAHIHTAINIYLTIL